jgi:hypothetical protein
MITWFLLSSGFSFACIRDCLPERRTSKCKVCVWPKTSKNSVRKVTVGRGDVRKEKQN